MKKTLYSLLVGTMLMTASPSLAEGSLQDWQTETDDLWKTESNVPDTLNTNINSSMLAWGFGLGIGIAILSAVLGQGSSHQSTDAP
ncbi:hypothetical protein [Rhabdochlamydiaceae symbiont of Dictyostelium giganteum]|uniref:hypothetical protein n=1 Tax=Rhabdochlamydiaceae symbiont of Dictyostelium giganteum TaxID=3342349 RepID=UPI00384BE15D